MEFPTKLQLRITKTHILKSTRELGKCAISLAVMDTFGERLEVVIDSGKVYIWPVIKEYFPIATYKLGRKGSRLHSILSVSNSTYLSYKTNSRTIELTKEN